MIIRYIFSFWSSIGDGSYGLNGDLAKTPRFDEVSGFDRERNGLFSLHVHFYRRGLVWVNLDANETPITPWNEDFLGADTQNQLQDFDMFVYSFDHTWNIPGEQYNLVRSLAKVILTLDYIQGNSKPVINGPWFPAAHHDLGSCLNPWAIL